MIVRTRIAFYSGDQCGDVPDPTDIRALAVTSEDLVAAVETNRTTDTAGYNFVKIFDPPRQ